jgi:hypothetical protein
MATASQKAKIRLENLSQHLTSSPAANPKFELEDHPIDSVPVLRVWVGFPFRGE